ncbi:hypothetical protein D3C76_1753310 [compost metagenome]
MCFGLDHCCAVVDFEILDTVVQGKHKVTDRLFGLLHQSTVGGAYHHVLRVLDPGETDPQGRIRNGDAQVIALVGSA